MKRIKILITISTRIFIALLLLLALTQLSGCGIPDKQEGTAGNVSRTVTCADRSVILTKGESATYHFDPGPGGGRIETTLNSGSTMRYLDWGIMNQTDDRTITYTAPSILLESRKVSFEGVLAGTPSAKGTCYAHLLDENNFGVADDTNTRGLVVAVHSGTDITKLDSLVAKEKGVIRNLDIPGTAIGLTGVTSFPPSATLFYRITGTLNVPGGNYWFRLTGPGSPAISAGSLMIDGIKRGGSAPLPGGEIPLASTPTTMTPNYNTGIALAAGKHTIQIDLAHPSQMALKLEWASAKPSATVPYTVIPRDAFDRD